jgi:hypothetical protein
MKVRLKRVLALLLAAAMLASFCSVTVFAGEVAKGTNGKTIYLNWTYYSDKKVTNKVDSLEADTEYYARLGFSGNPIDQGALASICSFSLYGSFDTEKIEAESILSGDVTIQKNIIGNEFNLQWASPDGIINEDEELLAQGCLARICFKTKRAVSSEELHGLFKVNAKLSSGEETNIGDGVIGNPRLFTIVECPAFVARLADNAPDFFPTTTAAKIAENLVGEYIDENGNATAVSDFTVTLPATGLVEGENVVTASYNGYTCDVTITVKPDTMTGISITHEPNMSYNSGDKLNLTGLVVSAQYASGDTVELGSGVYATDPAKNTELTVAEHNGMHITVKVGSFTAETTGVLTVSPANISGASIENVGPFEYTGEQIKPEPAVSLNGKELVKDTDYTLSYDNNTNVTTEAKVIVTAAGTEYTGSAEKNFEIKKATGKLTLNVNNEENAVTITYGDSIMFTDGNGIAIGGGNPSDVVIYYKTTDESTGAVYDSTSTQLNVGTYTFWAVRSADANHDAATSNEVVVTITPKKVTNPTLTVVGFGKGQAKGSLTFKDVTGGLAVPTGYNCYVGSEAIGNPDNGDNFEAGTTYTIAITLHPAANYAFDELDPGYLTVTINGEEQKAKIEKGPEFNGVSEYQAVVTATTADKDTLAVLLTPGTTPNAHYGMKLSDLSFTGGTVIVAGDASKTPVDGHFEWVNPNEDVGDPTVYDGTSEPYGRAFAAKFVPTDSENYAELSLNVRVHVHKATISISGINSWNYTEAFKYDGTVHTVELVIPEDLQGKIKVDYENNTATDVNTYKAAATISAVDDAHYAIYESVTTRELDWAIVKGDLTPTDAEKSVLFGTKEVTVTPADFGLTQDGIKIEVTHAGNSLITGYLPSDDMRSVTFMLRDTDKTDAANNASDTATLKFSSANYNEASGTLTIKIIDKNTDADTLKIDVPATVTYGDTVTPSVGESKPAGAGNVTFKFFDEDNHEVLTTAQPFDAGTYKVTASCESESTIYTAEATFTVEPREIEAKDVAFDKELTYTGNELTQTVTVTVNGKTLTVGTDYTVSDLTGTEPGSYPVTVAGTGNYTGTVTKSFEIAKADISSAEITYDAGPYGYTGKEWKPEVAVSFNDAALTADTDYTVSYENNINAGTAKIIITGIGDHFTGSTEKTFTINSAEISGCTFAPIADVTYNTKAHTPEVTVAISGRTLEADKDYTVSYASNINAGTATVTVTGKGNFTGTASKTFTINKAGLTLNPCTISELCTETDLKTRTLPSDFFLASETETGFSIKLTAVEGGDDIFAVAPAVVEGENKITFRLKNEVGAATFTVTVTPVSGNYNGGSYALTISTHDRTDVSGSISFPDGSAVYTGTGIKYENATISGYSGTLRYGYTPNASTGASLDASGLPLTVGTYTVAVTFNSDASFGYKTATFTITKATPTGTPGYTKLETSGKTLADAKLTVGTIRPAGTIAWDLPLTTVLEDGKAYAWTFTPNDTHNYTILTGTLVPYVDDGMDYIPGVIGGNTGSFNFHDVSRLDYFYDAVKWAAENGIASGTGRYTFSPNAVCTRAQTVTFLWRAAGSPLPRYRVCPFTDVQPSDYYYNAVLWAVEQGITTGLNATTFGPDVTVTRGQVATFLYRAASAAKPSTFNPFTDVKTTAYNYNAILWAYDNRITTGTSDTTFSPDAYCTRAQIVTFLYRYYQGR